ncbi:MAG TPA: hypothetical protein VIF83_03925 [Gemmatimonadaceae bacterium]|jgi:hypothetical protein
MFPYPAQIVAFAFLILAAGVVTKGLLVTWYRLSRGSGEIKGGADRLTQLEERVRKIEAATTSLLVDVSNMRDKQRFMSALRESHPAPPPPAQATANAGPSPMVTQSIPIIPRVRN